MIDHDGRKDKILSETASHALRFRNGRKAVELAVSNPSFELWLYLHHEDWKNGCVKAQDMEDHLRKLLKSYNKTNLDMDKFKNRVKDAVCRAEVMDTNPNLRWPENPGTHVYKIVKKILEILQ